MNTDIIYNISDQKKNTKIFDSKILLRCELVQHRQIADFARAVISLISIGFPIVTQSSQNVCFRDIERAHIADEFSSWKFLYFFSGQKCNK